MFLSPPYAFRRTVIIQSRGRCILDSSFWDASANRNSLASCRFSLRTRTSLVRTGVVKNRRGSAARDPMEVENAPEVPEGEGRLFFHLLLSPDGTHFAENRVREWCILQKDHTGHENNLWLDLRWFLQDCLVGLPRNSLPTFTEFGLWEVPKRQNYHRL
jgi:hypothetical protein